MYKKIVLLMMVLISLSAVGMAESITSVTASDAVDTITTGTSFVITSTLTADSGTVTATQILTQVTSGPGSFTVSDPSGGSYSNIAVSASGTTKTFTVTAGTAGTYTYTVTGTYSGGSTASSPVIVEFIDPTSLTVSGTPSTTQAKTTGGEVTVSISVQNSQGSDVTTSYAMSADSSYFTKTSGDPVTDTSVTITASTTATYQWTYSVDACFSGTKMLTFQLGDNTNAFSVPVTNPCSSSGSSGSSGGGGGGGGAASPTATMTLLFTELTNAKAQTIPITNDKIPLASITLKVSDFVSGNSPAVTVKAYDEKPTDVDSLTDVVYKYLELTGADVDSMTEAVIKFKVSKKWLEDSSYDKNKVSLYRNLGGVWTKLASTYLLEDSGNYTYEAATPGFSYFAIGVDVPATSTTLPDGPASQPVITTTTLTAEEQIVQDVFDWTIVIIIMIVLGIVGFVYYEYHAVEHRDPLKKR